MQTDQPFTNYRQLYDVYNKASRDINTNRRGTGLVTLRGLWGLSQTYLLDLGDYNLLINTNYPDVEKKVAVVFQADNALKIR